MEINIKNLTYSYKNKKLLDRINTKIEDNMITGIIGEYKTVLCDLLDGVKEFDNGEIVIGDIPLIKDNLKVVRKEVSVIKQNYEDQFFTNNVKEEIMFLISRLSYVPKDINKKINQALTMVGLNENIINRGIDELTSGEKKLLQIAVSIIYNPDIIIFDEVFTELDRVSCKKILKLIKELKEKYKKTIIIASNDVNLLYEVTDNIIILRKGKVLTCGKTVEVYQDSELLNNSDVDIPDLIRFTQLAKSKKVKLSFHRDIRDLIKDVYKHV